MNEGQPRTAGEPEEAGEPRLVRVSVEAPELDPILLLRAFPGSVRGFWQRGDGWAAWAGRASGTAVTGGSPVARVRRWAEETSGRLQEAAGPAGSGAPASPGAESAGAPRARFYGGFAFDAGGTAPGGDADVRGRRGAGPGSGNGDGTRGAPDPWTHFPRALFHLPVVELRRTGSGVWLSVVTVPGGGDGPGQQATAARRDAERIRRRLDRQPYDGGPPGAPARLESARSLPGRQGWRRMVEASLHAIGDGRLEKVVPARRVDLELARAADPVEVLSRLRRGAPATLPFLLEPRPDAAWVGAAPEIVAACRDGRFHATAVAGTAPDAPDPGERSRLARELLESAKDRAEHEIGVRDMRRALLRLAEVAEVDEEPRVLRLRGMQHLLTNLSARVPGGLHVLDALAEMHPTAAVNGAPRAGALRFLRETEPFHRGWYAGPVGWFDADGDGEFAPALRSVLLRGRRAHLFAGAGVVDGSEPDREWEETGWKLRPVLEGLGLDPDRLREDGRDSAEAGTRAGSGAAG